MPDYQRLSDDEILALASQPNDLTDEARRLLDAELHQRNLGPGEIRAYESETAEFNKARALNIGTPTTFRGTGRRFFGKSNYHYDSLSGSEEFDTTLWFVLLMFPLVPLGTYRLRRQRSENWWQRVFSRPDFIVIDKLSRNWAHIFVTWIKAVVLVLLIRASLPWLLEVARR